MVLQDALSGTQRSRAQLGGAEDECPANKEQRCDQAGPVKESAKFFNDDKLIKPVKP